MLQHFMQKRRFVPLVSLVFFILRFHVGCCGCEPKGEPPTSWYLYGLPGRIWSLRAGRMLILRRRIYYHKHTKVGFVSLSGIVPARGLLAIQQVADTIIVWWMREMRQAGWSPGPRSSRLAHVISHRGRREWDRRSGTMEGVCLDGRWAEE